MAFANLSTTTGAAVRDFAADDRVVLTLDAGGTNFVFGAMAGYRPVTASLTLPSRGDDLEASLATMVDGFERVRAESPRPPAAISFAFPGPCDYARGIVVAPPNLTAYRNVALGPMLEDRFGLPVFINNDGDLFTLGEAAAGLLPDVNARLERAGSPKRHQNLVGFTIGTGFGCGIVHKGALYTGDNSLGGEAWLLRHKLVPGTNIEEGVSIRAVRSAYAAHAGVAITDVPEPKVIADIATGEAPGNADAARRAFAQLGEVAGEPFRRLVQVVFDLDDPEQMETFLRGRTVDLPVPGSGRTVSFDALQRTGIGLSRLGTSHAVAIGAYAHALTQLRG